MNRVFAMFGLAALVASATAVPFLECPETGTVNIAHPIECYMYFQCSEGVITKQGTCNVGMRFDVVQGKCTLPSLASDCRREAVEKVITPEPEAVTTTGATESTLAPTTATAASSKPTEATQAATSDTTVTTQKATNATTTATAANQNITIAATTVTEAPATAVTTADAAAIKNVTIAVTTVTEAPTAAATTAATKNVTAAATTVTEAPTTAGTTATAATKNVTIAATTVTEAPTTAATTAATKNVTIAATTVTEASTTAATTAATKNVSTAATTVTEAPTTAATTAATKNVTIAVTTVTEAPTTAATTAATKNVSTAATTVTQAPTTSETTVTEAPSTATTITKAPTVSTTAKSRSAASTVTEVTPPEADTRAITARPTPRSGMHRYAMRSAYQQRNTASTTSTSGPELKSARTITEVSVPEDTESTAQATTDDSRASTARPRSRSGIKNYPIDSALLENSPVFRTPSAAPELQSDRNGNTRSETNKKTGKPSEKNRDTQIRSETEQNGQVLRKALSDENQQKKLSVNDQNEDRELEASQHIGKYSVNNRMLHAPSETSEKETLLFNADINEKEYLEILSKHIPIAKRVNDYILSRNAAQQKNKHNSASVGVTETKTAPGMEKGLKQNGESSSKSEMKRKSIPFETQLEKKTPFATNSSESIPSVNKPREKEIPSEAVLKTLIRKTEAKKNIVTTEEIEENFAVALDSDSTSNDSEADINDSEAESTGVRFLKTEDVSDPEADIHGSDRLISVKESETSEPESEFEPESEPELKPEPEKEVRSSASTRQLKHVNADEVISQSHPEKLRKANRNAGCPAQEMMSNGYFVPYPNDCSKYRRCYNGVYEEGKCLPGDHFNSETRQCTLAQFAGCEV